MDLILQSSLPHQQKAVDAVADVFYGTRIEPPTHYYSNPGITTFRDTTAERVRSIQCRNKIPQEHGGYTYEYDCLNLDIKMETGTGKTYVYVQTMYELHKRYGINKFIVAVPSLAIKAGARQFMEEEYVLRHFRDECGYDAEIVLFTLEPPKKKRKGRQYFPSAVSEFVKGSHQDSKKIFVLLVNMQLLKDAKNYILSKDDYGSVVEGFYRPYNALKATRPFVIIDEPHRFSRDQKAFGVIKTELAPQCIIRFGATFPEIAIGKGKKKKPAKDYRNLLYDLNACQSFNQGLIKGVAKEHFEPDSHKREKIKLLSLEKGTYATFRHQQADAPPRSVRVHVGDSLSLISDTLSWLTIQSIDSKEIGLSNGQKKTVGEEMEVDVFLSSYQEQMIRLALERHFETERRNFSGRTFKIKTLALFFIDDITSYRKAEDGKAPYILDTFERLLKEKITEIISTLPDDESEYKEYLQASLDNIRACHEGYFAQDNNTSDEAIKAGVDNILKGKKRLLSFKDKDGKYILLRFLFSKWTLKEGWDNPNVFTIAKLRSSGSEISKLQEVGRGLRLPVDECGNRISNEAFMLNYIVDFTEADFADRLVAQINSEIPEALTISAAAIKDAARTMQVAAKDLLVTLLDNNYVDVNIDGGYDIVPENRELFFENYPIFKRGVDSGKVTDRNRKPERKVKIRKAGFEELRELWEKLNQRYTIWYEAEVEEKIDDALDSILSEGNVFTERIISTRRDFVRGNGDIMSIHAREGLQYAVNSALPYGIFLKRVSGATNISVERIHKAICRHVDTYGHIDESYFNEQAVDTLIQSFFDWKIANLQSRFRYKKTNITVGATVLTHQNGSAREEITQGRIGVKIKPGEAPEKYLYDLEAYDSPLELENIESDLDGGLHGIAEVVVYGKIPRRSIAIPTIAGGTYSPDFMYVVKKTNGEKELNIIVETKDYKNMSALSGIEKAKNICAGIFFKNLSDQGYNVHFRTQLNDMKMLRIVKEVINQ